MPLSCGIWRLQIPCLFLVRKPRSFVSALKRIITFTLYIKCKKSELAVSWLCSQHCKLRDGVVEGLTDPLEVTYILLGEAPHPSHHIGPSPYSSHHPTLPTAAYCYPPNSAHALASALLHVTYRGLQDIFNGI